MEVIPPMYSESPGISYHIIERLVASIAINVVVFPILRWVHHVVRNWVPDPSVKTSPTNQTSTNVTEWRHVTGTSTASSHHHKNVDLGGTNKQQQQQQQQQHEARVSIHTATSICIFQTATITSATTTQPRTTRKILPFDDEATASSSFCVTSTTSCITIITPPTTTVPDYTHPYHHHIQFTCIIHIGNGMASTDDYSCVHTT